MRKVLLILFLVILVITGVLVGVLYTFTRSSRQTGQNLILDSSSFSLKAEIDEAGLNEFKAQAGFSSDENIEVVLDYHGGAKPEGAMIIEIGDPYPSQEIYTLLEKPTSGWKMTILIDKTNWPSLPKIEQKRWLQLALAQAIVIAAHPIDGLTRGEFNQYFNDIFKMEENSLWFSFGSKLLPFNLKVIPEIKAQSCGGYIDCYVNQTYRACPNGSVCYLPFGNPCPGQCQIRTFCIEDYVKYCSSWSWPSCSNVGCAPGTCRTVNNCYQVACIYGPWVNEGCGAGSCASTKRLQTRWVSPSGCISNWRCVTDNSCVASTPTPTPTPSCTVSLDPSTVNVGQGTDVNYTASVTVGSGSVDQVNYISSNTSVATVSPASDASQPYQTVGDTLAVGSSTITSDVVMSGAVRCTDTATLDVVSPGPWWQVKDADIITSGDIISSIPLSCALPGCNPLLGLEGLGGFPGVPAYGGSTAGFGEGNISSTGWLANTQSSFRKIYDYSFFSRLVRPDVVLTEISSPSVNGGFFASGGTSSRGFVWYHFDGATLGDLTITDDMNIIGDRKVVLLVKEADLYINGRITLQKEGEGFFMVIVGKDEGGNKGNIFVNASVVHESKPELQGVFLAEGQFKTGTGNEQLHIRGMVAAYGGVVLERDLTDNSTEPAEVFEFAPDLIFTYPRDLTFKRLRWKEVAP